MDKYQIVQKPLITEKGTHQIESQNAYPFQVDLKANKTQIKLAIEQIYNVKVDNVRTLIRKGKPKRRGASMGYTSTWKKAIVILKDSDHLDLF